MSHPIYTEDLVREATANHHVATLAGRVSIPIGVCANVGPLRAATLHGD